MNLLIIEDELRLSDMLRDYFVGKDHAVTLCGDGWNGLDTALTGRYDVIVLDVMLPGMDGFEVLRRLRAADDDTPVLMLTARSSLQDKLAGFESGAEDYLTKPFDIEELEARLCVLTKKRAGAENAALRFGELLLQRDDHLLHDAKSGLSVALSAKEFTLMSYFMENAGQLLSKEQITVRIWGYDIHVFGDAGQLARLTGILIDNAVRHTERGGEVCVALTADGRLSVRNQGEPIPEDERERIFERFYRVDKSRSRAEGRYGLGLSIAQRIAENHKAAIRVDCRDGWTDFFVKFSPISR